MNCYCGSGQPFSECCEPLIKGVKPAPTAEALMRSRYTAHVIADLPYLKKTIAPESRKDFNDADVLEWTKSEWLGLEIISAQGNKVEFTAKYKKDGKEYGHHEVAKFRKMGENWFFVDGDSHVHGDGQDHHHHHAPQAPVVRESPKIGRNDPCHCGSGKKFKKCHGTES